MDRRVVIVGFMGCGKTTVAESLARQLGCASIDLDSFIKERDGRSPAEIIEEDGEAAFRLIETDAFGEVLERNTARVIALGGGAWTVEANRALVDKHNCISVWLDAPFELCWQRIIAGTGATRPMAPNRASAQELFHSRAPDYQLARLRLDVSTTESVNETVAQLATSLGLA